MLFKNTSKRIMSICASGRGFTLGNPAILKLKPIQRCNLIEWEKLPSWKKRTYVIPQEEIMPQLFRVLWCHACPHIFEMHFFFDFWTKPQRDRRSMGLSAWSNYHSNRSRKIWVCARCPTGRERRQQRSIRRPGAYYIKLFTGEKLR